MQKKIKPVQFAQVSLFAHSGVFNSKSTETASADCMESDLGCTSRVYFDNVTLTLWKPCQYQVQLQRNKRSKHSTRCFKRCLGVFNKISLQRYFIEKNIYLIYSVDRFMNFNRTEPKCYRADIPYAGSG